MVGKIRFKKRWYNLVKHIFALMSSICHRQTSVTVTVWFKVLIIYVMLWLSMLVGQDPPVVTVQSVPATVATHVVTASITHTPTTTTRQPVTLPPTKSITTKKPPNQPSVTGAKQAGVTSLRLTTVSAETTASPRPGILERCCLTHRYNLSVLTYYAHEFMNI